MRRTRATLVAATTSALLAFGLAPTFGTAAQAADVTSITGTVSGAGGVSHVGVVVLDPDDLDAEEPVKTFHCVTGACSDYSITDLPAGEYTIGVDHAFDDDDEEYRPQFLGGVTSPQDAETFVYDGTGTLDFDFALDYGLSIGGRVTGPTGAAAEDVYVSVVDADTEDDVAEGYTDSTGAYIVRGLEPGEYKVGFQSQGDESLMSEWYDDADTYDEARRVPVSEGAEPGDVDAQLEVGGSIGGTVTVPAGSDPSDASVTLYRNGEDLGSVEVANGKYLFPGLSTGTYQVGFNRERGDRFAAEFYSNVPEASGLSRATPVDVVAGAPRTGIDETVAAGSSLTGLVVDDAGRGVPNTTVTAYTRDGGLSSQSGETDRNGRFTVTGLNAGTYYLYAEIYDESEDDYVPTYFPGGGTAESAATPVTVRSTGSTALPTLLVGDVKTLTASAKPTVNGAATIGSLLVATPGTWTPNGATFTYEWLRNGTPTGVKGLTYRVGEADVAKRLSVRVSATRLGSRPGSATSGSTAVVPKRTSKVSAKAKGGKKKATVSVTVSVPGVASPGGTVTVKDGAKVVRSGVRLSGGKATVALSKLKKGTHTFTVTYSGTGAITGGTAKATAKVKK